jgi:hypothetical protein
LSQALLADIGLSNKVNVCGKEAPGAPTITTVELSGGATASVTFIAPISNGGSVITSYTAIAMPGGITGVIEQSGSGTIRVDGLKPTTTYTFTVVANNLAGDSDPSATSKTLTTKDLPGTPTIGAAIVNGATKALVTFTAPASDGGSPIIRYTAIATPGGARGDLYQAGSGAIAISGLDPETTYRFTIFAANDLGESKPSTESASITTDAPSYTFACGKNATYTITDGVVRDAANCSGELILSNKARSIGAQAFMNSKINSISIPNSVTEFEYLSFFGASDLQTINIPSSVINIGEIAFIYSKISSFIVDPDNQVYSSVDGVLYNKDKTKLIAFPVTKTFGNWSIPTGVTELSPSAFGFVQTLTSLVIPEGVKTLGANLLRGSQNLSKISIPSTVTEFDTNIFDNATSKFSEISVAASNPSYSTVDGVLYNKDLTTLLKFPPQKNIQTFVVPSTVRVIGKEAFSGNSGLKTLSLGNNVTTIETGAFQGMSSLKVLNITASVTSIVVQNLFGYTMPSAINISSANPNYSSLDGVLYNKDKTTLLLYPSSKNETSFTIPSSVKTINSSAFDSAKLMSVIMPNSVTTIGDYAFANMTQLRKIIFSDNLTSIGIGAFSRSNDILSYIYCGSNDVGLANKPNGCGKAVPDAPTVEVAFAMETSTAYVSFTAPISDGGSPVLSYTVVSAPEGITSTLYQATSGTFSLSGLSPSTTYSFKVIATNAVGDSVASASTAPITTDDYKFTFGCGVNATYTIINGVAGNGGSCSGDIVLSSKATEIGVDAFRGSKITSIAMPGVRVISSGAFSETKLLKSVTIPSTVVSIAAAESYLEKGLRYWGPFDSSNIARINVDYKNPEFSSVDGVLFNKDKTVLLRFPEGKDASKWSIPSGVTSIGGSAFLNVNTLTKLSIPEGVTSIGYKITDSALNLVEISIPSTLTKSEAVNRIIFNNPRVTRIDVSLQNPDYSSVDGVLFNKDKTILERFPEGKDASAWIIPGGVTSIGEYAFAYVNSLIKLQIPEGVLSIPANIADSAQNLKEVVLPSTVALGRNYGNGADAIYYFLFNNPLWERITVAANNPYYKSVDGVLYNKDATTLLRFPEGKNVNGWSMPSTVKTIGQDAFAKVSSLTTFEIPEGVNDVDFGIAPWSSNLTEIFIPSTTRLWDIRSSTYENTSLKAFRVAASNPYYTAIDGVLYNKDVTTLLRFPAAKSTHSWVIPGTVTEIGSGAFMDSMIQKLTIPKGVTTIGNDAFSYMYQLEHLIIPDTVTSIEGVVAYQTRKLNSFNYCGTHLSPSQLATAGFFGKLNVCGKSVPSAPTVGVATATGTTTATVSFVQSATAGSYPIDSYTATAIPGGVSVSVNQVGSGVFEFTGLTPATSYVISIVATSLAGDSVPSQAVTVRTNKMTAVIAAFDNKTGLFAGSPIAITAPASASAGAWSYASSDASVVSVDGSNLVINKVGSVTITATQAATDSYLATTKTFTVTIDPIAPTLGAFAPITINFTNTPTALVPPSSSSDGAWSYVLTNATIGGVSNGAIIATKAGTSILTATQAATGNYLGSQITTTVEIKPSVSVTLSKRVITISLKGATGKVLINGKAAKIGKNTVTPGKKIVSITVAGKEIFKKSFTVK